MPKPKAKKKKDTTSEIEKQLYKLFMPMTSKINSIGFEKKLEQADIPIDVDYYLSKNIFISIFVTLMVLIFGFILLFMVPDIFKISTVLLIALLVFLGYIIYTIANPYMIVTSKVNNIKNNLSLAILGMSSVAESGAPPEAIFTTATSREKNQYVSNEFAKITYYIDNLGISLLEAIDLVAKQTPSYELKKFLLDLKSNIEAGGSLSDFMKKKADHARFEYKLLLDTQNKKAEMFGDIYSAVVIAGPLFLFSGVMLLGMVGGGIAGLSIGTLLTLGVFFLVPMENILFIVVLNILG